MIEHLGNPGQRVVVERDGNTSRHRVSARLAAPPAGTNAHSQAQAHPMSPAVQLWLDISATQTKPTRRSQRRRPRHPARLLCFTPRLLGERSIDRSICLFEFTAQGTTCCWR
uniref:Uncharacterized protein n=1 Tax=Arundo donax TaxID=35708 RepID=A0A0A9GC34_ARUDO